MFQDISEPAFHKTYRPLIPESAIKRISNRVWYHGGTYFETVVSHRVATQAKARAVPQDDPMLAGEDSEGLERYRNARASQEEIKLAVMQRTMIPMAELEPALMATADIFRRAGETAERQFGSEPASVYAETVAEVESAWNKLLMYDGKPDAIAAEKVGE